MALNVKIGDSIRWTITYKQSDNVTPVNLTGYTIKVKAVNKSTKAVLFDINSNSSTSNQYISVTPLTGSFIIVVKDTDSFTQGIYSVDIEYTTFDGFTSSSKTFELKVVERLI